MTYIQSKCPYCEHGNPIIATRTLWLIHLARHKEEIIKHLVAVSDECEFCSYPEMSASDKHAASHYRWAHQKHELLEWAVGMLEEKTQLAE